jgi:hypothetical protein
VNVCTFIDAEVPPDWVTGLETDSLPEQAAITVETENSRYDFTILSGRTGDVLVRGGRLFPEETSARLMGSSLGGSVLKLRSILIGFRMELYACERSIVTSRVRSIRVVSGLSEQPAPLFF